MRSSELEHLCSSFYTDLVWCLYYGDGDCLASLRERYGGPKKIEELIHQCERINFDRKLHAQWALANLWLAKYAIQHVRARVVLVADRQYKDFILKVIDDVLHQLESLEGYLRDVVLDLHPKLGDHVG